MSKIKERLQEDMMMNPEHYNNPDPTREEMEIPEPTDADLHAIEQELDVMEWDDLMQDSLGHA